MRRVKRGRQLHQPRELVRAARRRQRPYILQPEVAGELVDSPGPGGVRGVRKPQVVDLQRRYTRDELLAGYRPPDMRQSSQPSASGSRVGAERPRPQPDKVSEQLERWLRTEGDKTLGSLIDLFEEKSFAILFVLLLGVPALPLPTGGVTHVFEIIAVLLALQLVAGREQIWLPQRWCKLELAGEKQRRFIAALMRMIRRLERFSRPHLRLLFDHRLSNIVFGLLVIGGSEIGRAHV